MTLAGTDASAYKGMMQGYVARQLRVYLVDDHDLVRRGLRDLLANSREVDIVGEASSAAEAVSAILDAEPDIALLDLHLQDGTGIGVCRRVRAENPRVQGLLLTAARDDVALVAAVLADAAGFLGKLAPTLEIRDALRRVGAGKSMIEPERREQIVASLREDDGVLAPEDRPVLHGILDGSSDTELIEQLGLTREELDQALERIVVGLIGIEPRGRRP